MLRRLDPARALSMHHSADHTRTVCVPTAADNLALAQERTICIFELPTGSWTPRARACSGKENECALPGRSLRPVRRVHAADRPNTGSRQDATNDARLPVYPAIGRASERRAVRAQGAALWFDDVFDVQRRCETVARRARTLTGECADGARTQDRTCCRTPAGSNKPMGKKTPFVRHRVRPGLRSMGRGLPGSQPPHRHAGPRQVQTALVLDAGTPRR